MVQILGGLITYLILAIHGRKHRQEKVSIKQVRELRISIQNEAYNMENHVPAHYDLNEHKPSLSYAKT